MAGSSSNLTQLITSQAGKELTVNELFSAASPGMIFGRRQSSNGLSWDYFGGSMIIDGVATLIPNGTVTLAPNTTNYLQVNRLGTVSVNTTGSLGNVPLYIIVTNASAVVSYDDYRTALNTLHQNILKKVLSSDGNYTFSTSSEYRNDIFEFTSSVSLTATRDIIIPLVVKQITVFNGTTGGQSLRFIGATGTGITVANGKRAIIYADGVNIVRVTADN